ncbi:hypothetical protein [Roseibium sp.]|uniref:hypothetical protein n=1 Tax=Roseibium sp. TaxID=1936156 RepID=UPI003BAABC1F
MVLALDDKWVWDSWYVREGNLWHCFFLQAPKSIGDPDLRHWHVSYGHAVSRDLKSWTQLGTCFAPSAGPAWDDNTTWTGSVVRGDDGIWHLFYTGTSKADDGKHQKLGHAVSNDLHMWQRVGSGLILDRDERYEEYSPGRWHDRAFRDPWVLRDPEGSGWLMYFTARSPDAANTLEAGAIGLATSPDLYDWTLEDPVFTGGFGELEVPQVFEVSGRWYCLFCTAARFWSPQAEKLVGPPMTGSHYLIGDNPRGPWQIAPGPMLDGGNRYAARILNTSGSLKLMGFLMDDAETGAFRGIIDDPAEVHVTSDQRLTLTETV